MPYDFQALTLALAAAEHVLPLLDAVPSPYRKVASQCRDSTVSVPLNLAEGAGRFGDDRRYRAPPPIIADQGEARIGRRLQWSLRSAGDSVALGSAKEAKATLRVLRAAQAIDLERGGGGIELLDRVCALTWRLIHPRRH